MRTINHHHGDTFEFDVEVPADVSYLPSAGDKLWLAIKREPSKETDAPLYYLEQADTRFSIKDTSAIPYGTSTVDLTVGEYSFELGIIYATGETFTGLHTGLTVSRRNKT